MNSKLPVLLLIFNRSDVLDYSIEPLREYKPSRIYIAADGPRDNKKGESEQCIATRDKVLKLIDWQCEIKTLFRDSNLGCAIAVNSAISWFFEQEEFGIIIEDDVVLSKDFFRFAEKMKMRYSENDNIMAVNSQFLGEIDKTNNESYSFSPWVNVWGWATWARAWKYMDMSFSRWPKTSVLYLIKRFGFFKGLMMANYWRRDYKTISSGGDISSWATRWCFNVAVLKGLCITPLCNLSINVGCTGTDGAHYSKDDKDPYEHLKLNSLEWPIVHPNKIQISKELVKIEGKDFFRVRMIGLKKKLSKLLRL